MSLTYYRIREIFMHKQCVDHIFIEANMEYMMELIKIVIPTDKTPKYGLIKL